MASASGRVDARQEWKPLLCGVDACMEAAAVVCCLLFARMAAADLGTIAAKGWEGTQERGYPGRRLGLCAPHYERVRPAAELPGPVMPMAFATRRGLHLGPSICGPLRALRAVEVEKEGKRATTRNGPRDGVRPDGGWHARRVGRRGAAPKPAPSAPGKGAGKAPARR
jgi:hypothetical protein